MYGCKKVYVITDFHKDSNKKYRLKSSCKICRKKYDKERYEEQCGRYIYIIKEPIILEETFEKAYEVICKRLLHGNKGKNISKRDKKGKIICANCGKSYYICYSKSIGSALNTNPYYICSTKKNKGKKICNAENLSVNQVESYLEDLRVHYYDNVDLRNKAKIQQLKGELNEVSNITDIEVAKRIEINKKEIDEKQEVIGQLLDRFLSNAIESTRKAIEKRIASIEESIAKLESENKMFN